MNTFLDDNIFHNHFLETILEKNLEKNFFNVENFEEHAFLDSIVPLVESFLFGQESDSTMRAVCQQLIANRVKPDQANSFFSATSEIGIDYILKLIHPKDIARRIETVTYRTEKAMAFFEKMFYQQELENSQYLLSQYKMAVDASCIVSKANPHGTITYVNDKFCELSGYNRKELIGKAHNIVRHPEMPKSAFATMWATIKQGQIWHGTVKNLRKDGTCYIVDATVIPIRDEHKNIVEFISIRRDITEEVRLKNQMETELLNHMRTNMSLLEANIDRDICNAIPFGAAIINDEDKILHMNEHFIHITTAPKHYGGTIQTLFKPQSAFEDILWKETLQSLGDSIDVQCLNDSRNYHLEMKSGKSGSLVILTEFTKNTAND